jgi:hypothetical protein
MTSTHLYLQSTLPQWEIFLGIALITMGYIEKKALLTRMGWSVLMFTGLTALYFIFFGELTSLADSQQQNNLNSLLMSTSWQAVAGGVLAGFSLLLYHYKKKRYPVLAGLTIVYFILIFFLYYQVSQGPGKLDKLQPKTEQKK